MATQSKIKPLLEVVRLLKIIKDQGQKVVHCHGVFDLLHPGHIRHFQNAKRQGDILVVSLTADQFVNKGPGRPAFNENMRQETIAALSCVDYVVLSNFPDATQMIHYFKPNIYAKGIEYKTPKNDPTGKISEEIASVKAHGGSIYYTDDIVYSSSSLINRFIDPISPEMAKLTQEINQEFSTHQILEMINSFSHLKVLVIGDAIIDEYQYVQLLGQSGKGQHLTARCLSNESFLGGSLIIANHLAQFSNKVTLLTAVGTACPQLDLIHTTLDKSVKATFLYLNDSQTLTKKRYVIKDGNTLSKLFETYSAHENLLNEAQSQEVIDFIKHHSENYDLVLVCDFGNGFTNPKIINALSDIPNFLALNTQINSGNRGFNVVTNYKRADFISLNEPELRLAAHDRYSSLEKIASDIMDLLCAKAISITRGVNGVYCLGKNQKSFLIPALVSSSIDRVGAGDSYFSLASLALAKGCSLKIAGFLGSIASAIDVQIIGNKEPVKKSSFIKFLTRLLK